jgi:hypothetical protein
MVAPVGRKLMMTRPTPPRFMRDYAMAVIRLPMREIRSAKERALLGDFPQVLSNFDFAPAVLGCCICGGSGGVAVRSHSSREAPQHVALRQFKGADRAWGSDEESVSFKNSSRGRHEGGTIAALEG